MVERNKDPFNELEKLPDSPEKAQLIEDIYTQLKSVIDPELHIDIVNLGLIYGVEIYEGQICVVNTTLTTMGCPLADIIFDEIERAVGELDQIEKVHVKLVWYPPWTPEKMSRYARIALGITY